MKRLRFAQALLFSIAATACVDNGPTGVDAPARIAPQFAVPANWNGNVRIGVVPTATSITLGSTADFAIRAKTSGAMLASGNNAAATITMSTPAVTKWYVQVVCAFNQSTLDTWVNRAIADGHPYTLENASAGCVRVLLGDYLLSDPFSVRNAFRNLLLSTGYPSDLFPTTRTVSITTYRVVLGATNVTTTQPPVVTSSTGIITINGARYRGAGEVRNNSTGSIAGINELPMEEYLYGVVPRELGPIAFPEVEAQKAQAVAARTYALRGLGKRAVDGYDLLATTTDQVYGGYSAEHPVSTAAIDATRGLAATYNGALIDALYSSATGGFSANSEEAFSAVIPYLRGVPDAERGNSLDHRNPQSLKNARNPRSLRAEREGDFESDWSGRHNWTYEWSAAEMRTVLSAWKGFDVGEVSAINVLDRGPSGRVLLIEYVTAAGTFTHTKDAIRSSLKFVNANGTLSSLPSTLFHIEPAKKDAGFVVYGAGFGHGVGMGQTGAVGMAEKGHNFEEILKHYYRGIDLTVMY